MWFFTPKMQGVIGEKEKEEQLKGMQKIEKIYRSEGIKNDCITVQKKMLGCFSYELHRTFLIFREVTEGMKYIHIYTFQRGRMANWGHSMYK